MKKYALIFGMILGCFNAVNASRTIQVQDFCLGSGSGVYEIHGLGKPTICVHGMCEGTVQDVKVQIVNDKDNLQLTLKGPTGKTGIWKSEGWGGVIVDSLDFKNEKNGSTININCEGLERYCKDAATLENSLNEILGLGGGKSPVELFAPSNGLFEKSGILNEGLVSGAITCEEKEQPFVVSCLEQSRRVYGIWHDSGSDKFKLSDGFDMWEETVANGAQTVVFSDVKEGKNISISLEEDFRIEGFNALVKFYVEDF